MRNDPNHLLQIVLALNNKPEFENTSLQTQTPALRRGWVIKIVGRNFLSAPKLL